MKILLYALGLLVAYCIWVLISVGYTVYVAKKLAQVTPPFKTNTPEETKTMLILGDSTAAGVGTVKSFFSTPGFLFDHLNVTYAENYAVNGAQAKDIEDQVKQAKKETYDIILLQVGANDIVRFHDADTVAETLEPVLELLKKKSDLVIFISAGNMGSPPAIPFFLKKKYTSLSLEYHKAFETVSEKVGIMYVNTYQDPSVDPFVLNPKEYFSKDGFHPTTRGYHVWFTMIKERLEKE